jgi:hypothetical protein
MSNKYCRYCLRAIDFEDLEGVIMFEDELPYNQYAHGECTEIHEDIDIRTV